MMQAVVYCSLLKRTRKKKDKDKSKTDRQESDSHKETHTEGDSSEDFDTRCSTYRMLNSDRSAWTSLQVLKSFRMSCTKSKYSSRSLDSERLAFFNKGAALETAKGQPQIHISNAT